MDIALNQLLLDKRGLHILYLYTNEEEYMRQYLNFIEEGIVAGEHVIIVENERITAELLKELDRRHSAEVLDTVHFVNSLYFYRSSGSYNPTAIVEYFSEMIQPYLDEEIIFRSWAHVEWSGTEEPHHIVRDCEVACDALIINHAFPHVCAYGKNRLSDKLAKVLTETHTYMLAEEELTISYRAPL